MPTVSSYSFLSVYSCVVSSSLCIANLNDRLFHSRPSLPICPLLTCISQSAQSLSSRTVSFYSFRSLQLDHIANLEDRKSLLPRNHFPLDIVGIKAIITQALKQGQQYFSMPTVSSSSSYTGPSQPIWVVSSPALLLLLFLR